MTTTEPVCVSGTFLDRLTTLPPADVAAMPAHRPMPVGAACAHLRHALWLALPGHDGHDAARARARLNELLDDRRLDVGARGLARLELRQLRAQARLRGAQQEALAGHDRLQQENKRLREKLHDLTQLEKRLEQDQTAAPAGSGGAQ